MFTWMGQARERTDLMQLKDLIWFLIDCRLCSQEWERNDTCPHSTALEFLPCWNLFYSILDTLDRLPSINKKTSLKRSDSSVKSKWGICTQEWVESGPGLTFHFPRRLRGLQTHDARRREIFSNFALRPLRPLKIMKIWKWINQSNPSKSTIEEEGVTILENE